MSNLLLILAVLFASLWVLTQVLEGRAQPLTGEQQAKLSKWVIVLVFLSLAIALIRQLTG